MNYLVQKTAAINDTLPFLRVYSAIDPVSHPCRTSAAPQRMKVHPFFHGS
ncbi:hypothetical protein QFZ81_001536 [Paenibacillus sp. V4I9]|nr:hypothetical protein [Paenibacillus sp. V4I9]MDQ0886448.1 hypothetical protein [Paenibacillus sp. V4I9]